MKYGDYTLTRGYDACRELLEEGVTFSALFACNDDTALGAAKALRQAGLRIPQDVSLFGFDDAPGATWLEPGLSTVYLPIEDMIATAIDQAVRLANSEPVAPIPPFTGTLILRESVAAGPFFSTSGLMMRFRASPALTALQWSDDGGSAAPVHCQTVLPAGAGLRLL